MKYLSVILTCIMFGTCGSAPDPGSTTNSSQNGYANSNSAPSVVSNANSNSGPSAGPNMAGIPTDPNAVSSDVNSQPAGPVEAVNRGRTIVEGPPPPPGSKPPTVGASDNSAVSSEMLKDGSILERRVFSGNEYLNTLEIHTKGRERTVRLVLKNGKSIKLPADQVKQIGTPSAAALIEMAGITPKRTPERNSTGAKPVK
ncbi:MAG TPA: hypothetical protein PKC65_13100 [Pyrinomonadaceae bacterium]|nr:hypothetical protein [Pyrinomonadaceae bacterium]